MTSLSQADPATVFISYAHADRAAVLPLETALFLRGVRVLRDEHDLLLGKQNVDGLLYLINERCDSILFLVTPAFLESDFIWRHEVPAALERFSRDQTFGIIPVVRGVSFQLLAESCGDRGLPSLANFNAEHLDNDGPTDAQAALIARRTLRSVLSARIARTSSTQERALCFRTFAYTPPTATLDLDLDWSDAFADVGPTPDIWTKELLPALEDVANTLSDLLPSRDIDAWLKCRLPAAIALGHAFPPKSTHRVRPQSEEREWRAGHRTFAPLQVVETRGDPRELTATIEVAVTRDVTKAVTQWRHQSGAQYGWRLRFAPPDEPSRDAVTCEAQSRQWAIQVGDAIRGLWDREGVSEVHLFVASPVEFAMLLGQQLNDRQPIHVYFGDNELGYRRAFTLHEAGR